MIEKTPEGVFWGRALALFAAFFSFLTPFLPAALADVDTGPYAVGPVRSFTNVKKVLNTFLSDVVWLFAAAAIAAVFYAGFLYLTAGGDQEKTVKAKGALRFAVIAIIIGLMAYGLPLLISSLLSP